MLTHIDYDSATPGDGKIHRWKLKRAAQTVGKSVSTLWRYNQRADNDPLKLNIMLFGGEAIVEDAELCRWVGAMTRPAGSRGRQTISDGL